MPRQQLNNASRIFGLDLMRAIAILMVLAAHCLWIFQSKSGMFSQILALFGFLGVEIFFVLSGFLIGRILFRLYIDGEFNLHSVIHFLKRRWYRTFPNYFLILVINIAIAFAVGYSIENLTLYFLFLQNFAWPMPGFFSESWSLSVEEFAYIILPFVLLCAGFVMRSTTRKSLFLYTTLLLMTACFAARCYYHMHVQDTSLAHWNLSLKAVVIYRLDSIFTGVAFSAISCMQPKFWRDTKLFWFFAGVFMMGFFTIGVGFLQLTIEKYPFFWNVLYLPAASLSIAFFLPVLSEWKTCKSIVRKPVTFISLISYAIYLLHYGVILQTMKHAIDSESLSTFGTVIFTLFYIVITIFASYLLFRFYERPLMDMRETRPAKTLKL